MIAGLLHGRLAAALVGGIIAAPAYQPVAASAAGGTSSTAVATFTVNADGTWGSTGTGSSANSGLWYSPAVAGAGNAYQVRFTLTPVSGSGGAITNAAGAWIDSSASRTLQLSLSRYVVGTSTVSYTVLVEFRLIGGATVSSASFLLSASATVGGGGGGGCPAASMWVRDGKAASELRIGTRIDGVRAADPESLVRLSVMGANRSWQPCYRIVTESGAACILSESTPFTLRDGSSTFAPNMLGQEVLVDQPNGPDALGWETVVLCYPVGEMEVIRINVGGESLLAGEHAGLRIVSHNQDKN